MDNRFSTYSQFSEIDNLSQKLREKYGNIENFLNSFLQIFEREILLSERKFYAHFKREEEFDEGGMKNFLLFFRDIVRLKSKLSVEDIKKSGFSFSVKNMDFRKGSGFPIFDGHLSCGAGDILPFLQNTLLWFEEEEGGVAMLHPVEKSVLFTMRMSDFMPFDVGNLTIVRWVPFFYLLKHFIIPPFNIEPEKWQKAMMFAIKNMMTTSLIFLFRNTALQNGKRLLANGIF